MPRGHTAPPVPHGHPPPPFLQLIFNRWALMAHGVGLLTETGLCVALVVILDQNKCSFCDREREDGILFLIFFGPYIRSYTVEFQNLI